MKKITELIGSARDNVFAFIVYTLVVIAIALLGFNIIKYSPPIGKIMGLIVVVGAIYLELYFPTWIGKRKYK